MKSNARISEECQFMLFSFGMYQLFYDIELDRMKLTEFDEYGQIKHDYELYDTPTFQMGIIIICHELNITFHEFENYKK